MSSILGTNGWINRLVFLVLEARSFLRPMFDVPQQRFFIAAALNGMYSFGSRFAGKRWHPIFLRSNRWAFGRLNFVASCRLTWAATAEAERVGDEAIVVLRMERSER